MCKCLFVLVCFLLPSLVLATNIADRERGDPTRPQHHVSTGAVASANLETPTLSSVLIGKGRKLAVIDGAVMSEGDEKAGIKLWKIESGRVVVSRSSGARFTLELDNSSMRKEAQ